MTPLAPGTSDRSAALNMDVHHHFNGLKTAVLFAAIIGLLLAVGGTIAAATGNAIFIWVFALIGVGTTAYGYWNSDKLAIRAMHA